MNLAYLFKAQSIIILLILYYGLYRRFDRSFHVRCMSFAIAWDILLVLQIELSRSAIKKASEMMTNPWLLNFHVSMAVSTVLLYFVLIALGRKLLRGENKVRAWHKRLGLLTIVLRSATVITSFMISRS